MKRTMVAVAILFALTTTPAAAATIYDVGLSNSMFRNGACPSPAGNNITTINVGDTVKWTNCDAYEHDIAWDTPGFSDPPAIPQNGFVAQTFNSAGFYDYHCSIHPSMKGRVIVQGIPTPTTKATALPPTTLPPTTTTTATTTPPTTTNIDGVFGGTTTIPDASTTTTSIDEAAIASKDKGASAPIVVLLVLLIAGVVGGGFYAVRRMRTS